MKRNMILTGDETTSDTLVKRSRGGNEKCSLNDGGHEYPPRPIGKGYEENSWFVEDCRFMIHW